MDVVLTTGGTGLTPDDVTTEALRELFDKEILGFGEYFRTLSHEDVGTRAMLSRATAGTVDGTPCTLSLDALPPSFSASNVSFSPKSSTPWRSPAATRTVPCLRTRSQYS